MYIGDWRSNVCSYDRVSYKELDSRGNRISVQETVLLDSGKRQWFRCPTCNRRAGILFVVGPRSEERRVGKECRGRLWEYAWNRIRMRARWRLYRLGVS